MDNCPCYGRSDTWHTRNSIELCEPAREYKRERQRLWRERQRRRLLEKARRETATRDAEQALLRKLTYVLGGSRKEDEYVVQALVRPDVIYLTELYVAAKRAEEV